MAEKILTLLQYVEMISRFQKYDADGSATRLEAVNAVLMNGLIDSARDTLGARLGLTGKASD